MNVSPATYLLLRVGRDGIVRTARATDSGVVPRAFAPGSRVLDGTTPIASVASLGPYDVGVIVAEDGEHDVIVRERTSDDGARAELELLRSALRVLDKPLMISEKAVDTGVRRIVFTNTAFQKMVRRSETDLRGAPSSSLFSRAPSEYAALYTEIQAGRSYAGDMALARGDGTTFTSEFVIAPIAQGDEPARFLVSIHTDVSERRIAEQRRTELEESVRRSEKMAALGAVAAGVAHQVRNRLFGITATFDAFEARFGSRTDYPAFVSVIREDLNRLTVLMRDLMEYGSPPALAFAPGRIHVPVSEAVNVTAVAAEAAGVSVVTHTALVGDAGLLSMDRMRVAQVFSKLLEHAISRSPRGGQVEVFLERRHDDGVIVVRVRDGGKALRTEDLPRAFEPFFFERSAGLGLPIAHGIVERHGGSITAHNLDAGVEIAVTLPTGANAKDAPA